MFGRKRKELEHIAIEHALYEEGEYIRGSNAPASKEDVERQRVLFERLIKHLREEVKPGDKVLVEVPPKDLRNFRRDWETGTEHSDPFNLPVDRACRAILETLWGKGAETVSIESPHAIRSLIRLDQIEAEKPSWPMALVIRQSQRVISFPLRERIMAKKIAREMEGNPPARILIGGAAHSQILPVALKQQGVRVKSWKYNSKLDERTMSQIRLAYSEHNDRLQTKRARWEERQRKKRREPPKPMAKRPK
jgi:hypothetical protein